MVKILRLVSFGSTLKSSKVLKTLGWPFHAATAYSYHAHSSSMVYSPAYSHILLIRFIHIKPSEHQDVDHGQNLLLHHGIAPPHRRTTSLVGIESPNREARTRRYFSDATIPRHVLALGQVRGRRLRLGSLASPLRDCGEGPPTTILRSRLRHHGDHLPA